MKTGLVMIVAIATIAVAGAVGVAIWKLAPAGALCSNDGGCAQQWFSAASGWVGALATIFTLFLLREQIQDTRRQHQHSLLLENREAVELARRVVDLSRYAMATASHFIQICEQGKSKPPEEKSRAAADMKYNVEYLLALTDHHDLDEFDRRIDLNEDGGLQVLRANVQKLAKVRELAENLPSIRGKRVPGMTPEQIEGLIDDNFISLGYYSKLIGNFFTKKEADAQSYLAYFGAQLPEFTGGQLYETAARVFDQIEAQKRHAAASRSSSQVSAGV